MWLDASSNNVIVIHSLYGRGRSALMACAYMLFRNKELTAMAALRHFSDRRLFKIKHGRYGVESPSQERYVHHFARLMRQRNRIETLLEMPTPAFLTRIELLRYDRACVSVCV